MQEEVLLKNQVGRVLQWPYMYAAETAGKWSPGFRDMAVTSCRGFFLSFFITKREKERPVRKQQYIL